MAKDGTDDDADLCVHGKVESLASGCCRVRIDPVMILKLRGIVEFRLVVSAVVLGSSVRSCRS